MLFNSLSFALFLPPVVAIYFALPGRGRQVFLLLASYFFYASWRPEYLLLILASTLIDYWVALRIDRLPTARSRMRLMLLVLSLTANLGLLALFKYADFFIANMNTVALALGAGDEPWSPLGLLLPVGISFYTFQTLSYTIDVYRGRRSADANLLAVALYVAYFPQLVAGPIERSERLMPQLAEVRRFSWERATSGLRLMLFGFFKKLVIADNAAFLVEQIYGNPEAHSGFVLAVGTLLFALQIYGDFSGYSDIAIGVARIMGHDLMRNFAHPYLARSPSDFWNRWHISLSTWFRDYLYIPLGGNRRGIVVRYRNLVLVFLISGLWHGANWTFVAWGALHGSYLIGEHAWRALAWRRGRQAGGSLVLALQRLGIFALVAWAWIFFRADSIADALMIQQRILLGGYAPDLASFMAMDGVFKAGKALGFGGLLLGLEILSRGESLEDWADRLPLALRWAGDYCLILAIILFGAFGSQEFIYFQF